MIANTTSDINSLLQKEWDGNTPDFLIFNLPTPLSPNVSLNGNGCGWYADEYEAEQIVYQEEYEGVEARSWYFVGSQIFDGSGSCYQKIVFNYYKPVNPDVYEQE